MPADPSREERLLNLLLVTDDESLTSRAREAIEREGYGVEVVGSRDAPKRTESATLPLAVVDLRSADTCLGAVARSARATLAIAGTGQREEIVRALRAGASDYLQRDFSPEEFRAALERAVTRRLGGTVYLEYQPEGGELVRYRLSDPAEVTLGRDPANDISFSSQVVSRFHATIRRTGSRVEITDRDSRHGVFVNNRRVTCSSLTDGDTIRLGKSEESSLVFRHKPPAAPPVSSAPTTGGESSPRELKDLAALLDTFLKLNSQLVLEDVLALVLTRSVEFAGAERGLILLLDESAGAHPTDTASRVSFPISGDHTLFLAMARHRDGTPIDPASLAISQKIPEEVISSGKGIIEEDLLAGKDSDFHVATIEIGVRSAMCVPLRARKPGSSTGSAPSLLGILYVDSSSRARRFSPQLLRALESLASEAAKAILNARFYQLSMEKRRIDEEMQIAREIQTNLLPPASYRSAWLELHGSSRPSQEVGGDIMNYYPYGTNRIGLLVGDVSGKGIPAAIFSALLDGHFHSLSSLENARRDLPRLAGELNRYLVRKSSLQKFVTFVFGILEEDGRLDYVNAGHNPPLLVTAAGNCSLLEAGGMIMGMFEEASYEAGTVHLRSGDVLVLFSDGLTEARAPDGARFTFERLKSAVVAHHAASAGTIHDRVLEAVTRFVAGTLPSDDVTLLVVKRVEP